MKRIIYIAVIPILLTAFAACSHQISLVNPKDGMTIHGTYHQASDRIEVQLPSGEVLRGQSVSLADADAIPVFYRDETTAGTTSGASKVYAILTDDKGTMMEAVFEYSKWTGHGFGKAKTNKGEEYKIIF